MLIIDLNSASHVIADAGESPREVPAAVALGTSGPMFGESAVRLSRLSPLLVVRGHWENLATPLPRAQSWATTHGDLAYAQIPELWPEDQLVGLVTVSPAAGGEDIARLAGVFGAAGREVLAWVDAAVAATAMRPASQRALWVEVESGRTVLVELARERIADGRWLVHREAVQTSRAVGANLIEEAVAQGVAQHCLREARFDPLAVASSAQALHDALPGLYAALAAGGPAKVLLADDSGRREVELDPAVLAQMCAPLVAEVVRLVQSVRRAGESMTLHVGHRIAVLPGLVQALGALPGIQLDCLPFGAAVHGARHAATAVASQTDGARWLMALEASAPEQLTNIPIIAHDIPTHVLWQGRAWPLLDTPLRLGREPSAGGLKLEGPSAGLSREHCQVSLVGGEAVVEDLSTYGTWLNGERVRRRARLRAGDVLRLGIPGVEVCLVTVESQPPTGN